MNLIPKPFPGEYDPYTIMYIDLLPNDGSILEHLRSNRETMKLLFLSLTPEQWLYRYAVGKWTTKEILLHIIDSERIFAYRMLRFARNDATPLSGFDQDPYVIASEANERTPDSLIEEYLSVRNATLSLCDNIPENAWMRTGIANNHPVSVRALVYITAGHELHHLKIIKERYFPSR